MRLLRKGNYRRANYFGYGKSGDETMKPILFSTPMVKALLNTKPNVWPAEPIDAARPFKSQTRRVIKPQPVRNRVFWQLGDAFWSYNITRVTPMPCHSLYNRMPYKPGDILYVRETWSDFYKDCDGYIYRADETRVSDDFRWKPSIFMPREAARLFLEVKSVRVERLQDITPYDALCEGIQPTALPESMQKEQAGLPPEIPERWKTYSKEELDSAIRTHATSEYMERRLFLASLINKYQKLWESLNAKRGFSWDANPWVWVYEFGRVENEEPSKLRGIKPQRLRP